MNIEGIDINLLVKGDRAKICMNKTKTKKTQRSYVPVAKKSVFSWSMSEPNTVIISRRFSNVVDEGYFLRMKSTKIAVFIHTKK